MFDLSKDEIESVSKVGFDVVHGRVDVVSDLSPCLKHFVSHLTCEAVEVFFGHEVFFDRAGRIHGSV